MPYCKLSSYIYVFKCFVFNIRSTWGTVLYPGYKWMCTTYVMYVIFKLVNSIAPRDDMTFTERTGHVSACLSSLRFLRSKPIYILLARSG